MIFPNDIKNAMRDCILKLLWPKNDIIDFFKSNSCTKNDLDKIGDYKTLNRKDIVDIMFDVLNDRVDGGLGSFRAMLQSLIEWEHFDPYYFDNLKQLNRVEAERSISHLKQLQEIRIIKFKNNVKSVIGKNLRLKFQQPLFLI